MEKFELVKGVEIINGFKAALVENEILVISDLQLGEELYFAEKGIFVPQIQLKEIKKELREIFKVVSISKLIINGDFKHEFGKASEQEWREVKELVNYLSKKVEEIILVRGNHDNYLLTIASYLNLKVFDPYYEVKGFVFTHGHKRIRYPKNSHTVIIGHEQPAILLKKGYEKMKLSCFLCGKLKDGKNLVCLPAFSPLASGTTVNLIEREELLSPILKEETDFEELKVIAVDKELGILKFPTLKKLKLV